MENIIWHKNARLDVIDQRASDLRRSGGVPGGPVPEFLKNADVSDVFEVVATKTHKVAPAVRSAKPAEVRVTVPVNDGSDVMLVVRHPSGALTFHAPQLRSADGKRSLTDSRRPKKYQAEFQVPVGLTADDTVRRGVMGAIVDAVVDAVVVKVKEFIAAKTVDVAEKLIWKLLDRKEGLHKITRTDVGLALSPVAGKMTPGPNGKALLFLHGTFSTTQGSFDELVQGNFFDEVAETYGDAIYGFEHFSVSVTPEKNALDLLKTLPNDGIECDVITQSRGGLVLRNLVERGHMLENGDRFRLGRAALVASPNEGTPLASPDRWEATLGWIANILDLFPPNPVTTNAAMVARWITWFAKFGVKAAEGLEAMNMSGDQIRVLQSPPGPGAGQYSTLSSNFEPDSSIWARALDLGMDWFFEGANDLVVPTAGAYRVDRTLANIPAEQIGVYGPGGNIDAKNAPVHHINAFSRKETQRFLVRALRGEAQGLPPFDPSVPLPVSRRSSTGALLRPRMAPTEGAQAAQPSAATAFAPVAETARPSAPGLSVAAQQLSSVFELMVVNPNQVATLGRVTPESKDSTKAFLYAAYGGARVAVPFWLKKSPELSNTGDSFTDKRIAALRDEINMRRRKVFGMSQAIKAYMDGKTSLPPFDEEDLRDFGEHLFAFLLPDEVRRLYDVARERERDKLFIIFTSMIPWVADLPWEFARDPERGTFLATEDVYFMRNVLTPTPVEKLPPKERLRVLVVTAEPRDLIPLSADEETARLDFELRELQAAGLIEVDTLKRATPRSLHRGVATGGYDVLHFIGHGYWNQDTGDSGLVMEDEQGLSNELGGRALREILAGRGMRLMFLNACDTGRGRRSSGGGDSSLGGVAQDLFSRGVPNVIANQFPVGDRAAVAFARSIYDYLANGKTVVQSVREARIAANFAKNSQSMDWAVPVVYARDPEDRLVARRRPELNG